VDDHEEWIQAPAQCKQQSLKDTTSGNSQHGKTKSYRCQICGEIFLSAHQLFSHELRDHEHVGILQVDQTKNQPLPKYNQCEKVSSSENGVHETKMHDRTLWKEASNLTNSQKYEEMPQVEACIMREKSQKQGESHKTHVGGKLQPQDGKLQTELSDIRGKSQKQDGDQQTDTCSMGRKSMQQGGDQQTDTCKMGKKSQKQDGNQQTDTCKMGRKSQKQDWNQQTDSCNMETKSQKQDGDEQTDTCNMGKKSQKQDEDHQADTCDSGRKLQIQDGNPQIDASGIIRSPEKHCRCKSCPDMFKSSDIVCQHQIKIHDSESEVEAQTMNSEQERDTVELCSLEVEGSIHEIRKHDGGLSNQNTYLICKESIISESQQFECEGQDHDKETELLQQDDDKSTVKGKGEESVSEVLNLPEVTSSPSKVIPLPYKCHVCEESFGTKCDLFYHDLQVHVGITKPATVKSWDISFKGTQKNLKEKTTLNKGEMKRKAKIIPEEQQPVKVIITEQEDTNEQEELNVKNPVAEEVTLNDVCKTDVGNKPIQELVMKKGITQGHGKVMKVGSGKLEHIQKTIEAITAKYPWNKTLVERGRGSELGKQDSETQPKTFVIVKDGPQSGEGNTKKSGGYRIDVVTNYVVSKSQVKQFLMNYSGSDKE
jgi:hypothetical protein